MDRRGLKRSEVVDTLPADKRACSLSDSRTSSSASTSTSNPSSPVVATPPPLPPPEPSPTGVEPANAGTDPLDPSSMEAQRTNADSDPPDPLTMEAELGYDHGENDDGDADADAGDADAANDNDNDDDDDDNDDNDYNTGQDYDSEDEVVHGTRKDEFKRVVLQLVASVDLGEQLANLTELCKLLCFCSVDRIVFYEIVKLVPKLVELAGSDGSPEIILMSIRAITYLCDVNLDSSALLVKQGVVPIICGRLYANEYMDIAEQCLQALGKMTLHQPIPCLQGGAVIACLNFIDSFPFPISIQIQRVAITAVENMCKKLPSDCSSFVMEASPSLCNILQNEDHKIVEAAITCLIRITESLRGSPELLDKLCKHNLIQTCANMIVSNGGSTLGQANYEGLIRLLSTIASGSLKAVKILLELNISSTLKDILNINGAIHATGSCALLNNGHINQINEVMTLLIHLLPTCARHDTDDQLSQAKKKIIMDQPRILHQFAMDILPVTIQLVNSGANLHVCHGCVLIVTNIVCLSTSDVVLSVLMDNNISRFLASLFTWKDHHVVMYALRTADILLQRHPDVFLNLFVKEGTAHAVNTLLTLEDNGHGVCQPNHINKFSISSSQIDKKNYCRCLCSAFEVCWSQLPQTDCKLAKETVMTFANHIKATYFTSSNNIGSTEILQKLKTQCSILIEEVDKTDYSSLNEWWMSQKLEELVSELNNGEPMSTFEFIESGVLKSLAHYLSNAQYLRQKIDCQDLQNHTITVLHRFRSFAKIILTKHFQHQECIILKLLVQTLQSALSSLDDFPVISSLSYKPRITDADIPRRSTVHPCLNVCFVRDEKESLLRDYHDDILIVEASSSLDDIERFIWPDIGHKDDEEHSAQPANGEAGITGDMNIIKPDDCQEGDSELIEDSQESASALSEHSRNEDLKLLPGDAASWNVRRFTIDNASGHICASKDREYDVFHSNRRSTERKLIFYFDGRQLDESLTLYQGILQHQINMVPDLTVGPKFWTEVYKITYKRVEKIDYSKVSSEVLDKGEVLFEHPGKREFYSGSDMSPLAFDQTDLLKLPVFSSLLVAKLPTKLENSHVSYDILFMLKVLEGLNRSIFHLLANERANEFAEGRISELKDLNVLEFAVPQKDFLSIKLTEKLEQQMGDPLSSSTGSMPAWCNQLVAACPFLFSFEARCKYFRLSTFSCFQAQHNTNLQGSGNAVRSTDELNFCSISRKKFMVDRSRILESATKIMALHGHCKAVLEVEYSEEIGTGLGPTMEFYNLVSQEFQKIGLSLWRGDYSSLVQDNCQFVSDPLGLFPRPWSAATGSSDEIKFAEVIKKFTLLGKLVAKALQDRRVFDLPLSRAFYRLLLNWELDIYDIQSVDPKLGKALLEFQSMVNRKRYLEDKSAKSSNLLFQDTKLDDLCLEFSLPGYPDYSLAPDNNSKMVNDDNLGGYVSQIVDATVGSGILRQLEAFKLGFNEVIPLQSVQIFSEDDLERLLCGEQDAWDIGELLDNIEFDHGYTASCFVATNFLEVIRDFKRNQRRAFLQFVTGAPRLPPGGLASLNPKLTVVCKHCHDSADMDLPSVMTCANYLKLPAYSSKEMMRDRLLYAMTEGQGSFHLS